MPREIKEVQEHDEQEVLAIKENHVLSCFTDYLYHKRVSSCIQEELERISMDLNCGAPSIGIIKVSSDSKNNLSPWQNELLARESDLIKEQDKHEEAMAIVDKWIAEIKNEDYKGIIVEYLINNRCENAEMVADGCHTTSGNVCKVAKRIINNIARRIS